MPGIIEPGITYRFATRMFPAFLLPGASRTGSSSFCWLLWHSLPLLCCLKAGKVRAKVVKKMENKFLFNDGIIVRFISLFVIGAILFTTVWHLSYHFLPEGILQGKTGSAIIVGSDVAPTMLEEWGTIVMWNLGVLLLIVLVNFIRYPDRFPLGYITPLGMIALYAVFLVVSHTL